MPITVAKSPSFFTLVRPSLHVLTEAVNSVKVTPSHTLWATSSKESTPINLVSSVKISNNSGEDWENVTFSISTVKASDTIVLPSLKRWTVDFGHSYQPFDFERYSVGDDESDLVNQGELLKGMESLFPIKGTHTIKNGDQDHTIVIQDHLFGANIFHISRPKLEEVVYLLVCLSKMC